MLSEAKHLGIFPHGLSTQMQGFFASLRMTVASPFSHPARTIMN
jgi:hypothetical protein